MLNPELIKQKIEQLIDDSPIAGLSNDVKTVVQAQIQSIITSMNLVTREEFDAQLAVLERSQELLGRLEQRINELELQLQQSNTKQ